MASVGGFFRGTSASSDFRFTDSEKKLIKSMKFPANFNEKLDVKKVNLDIMKTWIAKEIVSILGFEDDVLIDMIYNMLALDETIDPKHIQVTLTPFLEKNAASFTEKLWNLLLSAQNDPMGIPAEFIQQRMEEIERQKEKAKATEEKIKESIGKPKEEAWERGRVVTDSPARPSERKMPLLRRRSRERRYDSHRRSRSRSRDRHSRYHDRRSSRSRSHDRSRRRHKSRHGHRSHSSDSSDRHSSDRRSRDRHSLDRHSHDRHSHDRHSHDRHSHSRSSSKTRTDKDITRTDKDITRTDKDITRTDKDTPQNNKDANRKEKNSRESDSDSSYSYSYSSSGSQSD
ncbi:hypothetical protein WA538_001860 [Blastocystis sp. DL]